MKVTYFANATVLIEHQNQKILCDPWLTEGIYYGSWYHYPPMDIDLNQFFEVDGIYISHIHPDHLDAATLKQLPKSIPIYILEYEEKFVKNFLQRLGFEKINELAHEEKVSIGPNFSLQLFAADNCDPQVCGKFFHCQLPNPYTKTKQIDSLAVFSGGGQVVVNTNDCPYALAESVCQKIVKNYHKIDFLLVGYRGAGPYPQCFEQLNEEQKLQGAKNHQQQFLQACLNYLTVLKPFAFLPFAGQYTLGGKLAHLNRYLGPNIEELPLVFARLLREHQIPATLILLNRKSDYDIAEQRVSDPFILPDPKKRQIYIDEVLSNKQFDYESDDAAIEQTQMLDMLKAARQRLLAHQKFFGMQMPCNLYLEIDLKGFYYIPQSVEEDTQYISKEQRQVPYLSIKLDPRLLKRILERKAHWNNAEVGSHLFFSRDPNVHQRALHYLLAYFHI